LENKTHQIELSGRVVEILEHDGKKSIRVYCDSKTIMLTANNTQGHYLGERVLVKGTLLIEDIQKNSALN